MILLHAGLLDGHLYLWAERKIEPPPELFPDGAAERQPAPPRDLAAGGRSGRKRGAKAPVCRPHPFAAERTSLREALTRTGLRPAAPARAVTLAAWLPTRGNAPLPSSPLVGEAAEEGGETALAPWSLPAIGLGLGDLQDLLAACAERSPLAPGVAAAADLACWTGALAFAASLVTRQRYLPGLAERNGRSTARWEPVFTGPDARAVRLLARALPPACRALSRPEAAAPPRDEPEAVVRAFLGVTVDRLVRESCAPAPPAAAASLHDWWLHALTASAEPDGEEAGGAGSGGARLPQDSGGPRRNGGSAAGQWDPKELDRFHADLAAWRRPIGALADAPFRLCFRLEEPPRPANAGRPGTKGKAEPRGSLTAAGPEDSPEAGAAEAGEAGAADGEAAAGTGEDAAPEAGRTSPADGRWTLRYLLQVRREPGLLLPLEEVWRARGKKAALLRSAGGDVQAYLFAALGQAAGIYPALAASLEAAEPCFLELDNAGAYDFLSSAALALEGAGFGVLLPREWTRLGAQRDEGRLRLQARIRSPRQKDGEGLSANDLVEFQWEVTLGGQALTRRELESLAKLKTPLVALRGRWVEVRPEELQAVLRCLESGSRSIPLQEAVRRALGARATAAEAGVGVELDGVRSTGWIGKLLKQLESRAAFEELPPPEDFRGTLRPYQRRGYSWLQFLRQWGLGTCLADDMGLGKTVQVLALIQRDREAGERRPVLLVCPTSVLGNWRKEAARFTPGLAVKMHHGQNRPKGKEFTREAAAQAIVLTSYSLLHRDLALLQKVRWSGAVLDEAQNIKNPETRQARAARALKAGYRCALTGTPVENHVGDLWSIMEFLNPGFLGSLAEFRRRFLLPIQVHHSPGAAKRLRGLVGPFILRRLKTDRSIISDLPEKVEMDTWCSLTREQAGLYAAVLKQLEGTIDEVEGIQRKGLILSTLLRLKQICNHPAQFLGQRGANGADAARSGKLTRLTEMLEEVREEGDKALIFTQFAEMGRLLKAHLEETFAEEVLFLHGEVSRAQRDRMVERFQEEEKPVLFVLSLKAGGTGLNLTRANRVFHFDRWWNPAVENQATDRAFRLGQTKKVLVHRIVCTGTLEEKIGEMIEQKRRLAGEVVGEGEGWLTELSNDDLKGLLALREEAVAE